MTKMMKVVSVVCVTLCGSIALAKPAPAPKAPAADWDPKAAAELKGIMDKFMDAWGKQDVATLKGTIAEDMWSAWDLDMAMKPIGWTSKAEVDKFFDEAIGMMKSMGGTMSWKTTKSDCKASGALGVCMVEGEYTTSMPKMPPMTVQMVNTEVFAKENGSWKYVHHHGSVGKESPLPSKSMAVNSKTASGWMDMGPEMPGVKVLQMWMSPSNMYSAALLKATQPVKEARHIHPYPFTYSVLEGSIVTSDANGKDVEYGPGSVIYRAANEPHQTTLKAGAVIFAVNSGPMKSIPVDEKGQPIQHQHAER